MYVDSKRENSLPAEDVAEHAELRSSADMETRAHVTATFTRMAFFLSILTLCVVYSYQYFAALLYGKDSMPSGTVGLLIVVFAAIEMSAADYAKKLPFYYAAEEPSIPYSFFVTGGFATTVTLLWHESLNGPLCIGFFFVWSACVSLIHVMEIFAIATVVLGVAIIWNWAVAGGEDFMETRW